MEQPASVVSEKLLENVDIDTSFPKVIGIGVVGIITALLFGYFLAAYFNDSNATNIRIFVLTLISASLFLISFLLQVFYIKGNKISNYIILLESLALIAPILGHFSLLIAIAWAVLVFGLWNSRRKGKNELENLMRVKFFSVERHTIPPMLTIISVVIGLIYLGVLGFNFNQELVSKRYIRFILIPAEPIFQKVIAENFSIDMTANKLAEAIIDKKLKDVGTFLPGSVKNVLISQALDGLRMQAAGYGLTFKNTDTISDVVYNFIVQKVNSIPKNFSFVIPVILAFLIFVTIKGVGIILRWIIMAPAFIIYKFLLTIGFASLAMESRRKEIIVLR